MDATARRRSLASLSASRQCAGSRWSRRRSRTKLDFIRQRCSARWARLQVSALRSGYRRGSSSMAGGIIEYLAEGAWTKRLHAGWAAQAGIRAALLGRAGFSGPRTVFEGVHGFFYAFARTSAGDFAAVTDGFGTQWVTETLAFKPYPCGTMTHPYIDCARRLGRRVRA